MPRWIPTGIATVIALALALPASAPAAPVLSSISGWSWGNPRPVGVDLHAIDAAGPRGYAVGDFGTLLRTDDGGTTWTGIATGLKVAPVDLDLLGVVNADTFFAGGGCTLLRSTDGITLSQRRFPCDAPLAAFHFISKDVGHIVRTDGGVWRTTDGGRSFTERMPVPMTHGPVNDVRFINGNIGVAATGTGTDGALFRTDDGGLDWTLVHADGAVRGVFWVSPTVGYAVGRDGVLRSGDGGISWAPEPAAAPSLRWIRCLDEMRCVVVDAAHTVHYTDDGFTTLDASTMDGNPVPGLAATFMGGVRVGVVGRAGDAFLSDDGGSSFFDVFTDLNDTFRRLRLTSPSTVHAPGRNGSVARTTDGGATWTRLAVPTTNDIVDVAFPTASLGYVGTANGGVWKTTDGGSVWVPQGSPSVGFEPRAIVADGQDVLLAGPEGIERSDDGAMTFTPVGTDAVEGIRFDDAKRVNGGIVVWGSKAIVFTDDGGATFQTVQRPPGPRMREVDFVTRDKGFVIATDGGIWKTKDRGDTWRRFFQPAGGRAYEMAWGDSKNGLLASDEFFAFDAGWVLRTSDGGASWRPQLVDRMPLRKEGLAAAPGNVGYALAPGSSHLFRTISGGDRGDPSTLTIEADPPRIEQRGAIDVRGRLTPAVKGAKVEVVAWPEDDPSELRREIATVRSDGTFSVEILIERTSRIMAEWGGSRDFRSDGTRALRVRVGP